MSNLHDQLSVGCLAGRVALVTAAAQGIGRSVAEQFAMEGALVHASDINAEPMKSLEVTSAKQLDATDFGAVQAYANEFEHIDILVHGVGYVHQGTIEETNPEDWRRSINITLDSAYNVLSAVVPKMKKNGGSIITIASVASSIKGFPKRAAYGAAKGGVIGLTKALAADYVEQRIRCNAVCPGTVASPSLEERVDELAKTMGSREAAMKFFIDRQPAGRFGTTSEIADLCVFLASDQSSFINGQTINIDGGITI